MIDLSDFKKPAVSEKVDEAYDNDSFQDFNEDEIFTCQDLIYKLTV